MDLKEYKEKLQDRQLQKFMLSSSGKVCSQSVITLRHALNGQPPMQPLTPSFCLESSTIPSPCITVQHGVRELMHSLMLS